MLDRADLSFLADPGAVWDWRMTLLYDAVREAGVLATLPASAADAAAALGLDAEAVRMALDALTVWGAVVRKEGRYRLGPEAPDDDEAATLGLHARSMRRWCADIDDRLHGPPAPEVAVIRPEWLDALAGGQGGDTFGEDDYRAWLTAAGFELGELVDVAPRAQTLLVARPV